MGLTTSPIDWYAARTAGIIAYLILTGVVLVGLTLSGQLRVPHWPKFAVTDVHRFGGLLVGVFVSIHIATIAIDTFTPFSFTQLLVPLSSHYRPLWTGLGIVAAEMLVALAVTNALRTRIPYRWWRRIHILNFAVWGAATVHGIGAGTDTPSLWMTAIYAGSVSSVLAALVWRSTRKRLAPSAVRGLAATAAVVGLAVAVGLTATPHSHAPRRAVATPLTFADSFRGSVAQRDGAAGSLVSIVGSGKGSRRVLVRLDVVTPDGQTITDTALQLKDIASGSLCSGTISRLGASGFTGTCSFAGGSLRTVSAAWRISAQTVTGSLSLNA
jgi:hypothetical protein